MHPNQAWTQISLVEACFHHNSLRLSVSEICFVEGLKDYIKIHTPHKVWVTKASLGGFTAQLPADQFVRIHRSFVVGIKFISGYTTQMVEVGPHSLPIGRTFREGFEAAMG